VRVTACPSECRLQNPVKLREGEVRRNGEKASDSGIIGVRKVDEKDVAFYDIGGRLKRVVSGLDRTRDSSGV
jgi:hypothetical protein